MRRPHTSAPGDGSRTITITGTPPSEDQGSSNDPANSTTGTLKLRASTRKPRQKVIWREDVVDNEGAGKKSSKICCIYHKPKAFDESSDEDDSDTESESSCDHNHASHRHSHISAGERGLGLDSSDSGPSIQHIEHADSPNNAYEIGAFIEERQA
ncbi:hypothetical protein BT96DRAFT_883776 [Gymnopus androsaceus JB14]|uniref:Type 1 phosphatases regulator n=1 Tax=Gymnopus androsaceus JB14 TaxID=1447944 RepID=A0A6A4HI97_9AGAR|nr:hypothetical protein BT96DRAFT_883776 [Gymnopus androsaceus JB14]